MAALALIVALIALAFAALGALEIVGWALVRWQERRRVTRRLREMAHR